MFHNLILCIIQTGSDKVLVVPPVSCRAQMSFKAERPPHRCGRKFFASNDLAAVRYIEILSNLISCFTLQNLIFKSADNNMTGYVCGTAAVTGLIRPAISPMVFFKEAALKQRRKAPQVTINPFTSWTGLAMKAGEMMLSSA